MSRCHSGSRVKMQPSELVLFSDLFVIDTLTNRSQQRREQFNSLRFTLLRA